MTIIKRTLDLNDIGRRLGDSHHNAKLANRDVELLLALRAEGWGYRRLAAKFEVSKTTVRNIVSGRYRNQVATAWKTIKVQIDD